MVVLDFNPYDINSLSLPDLMLKTKFDASPASFRRLSTYIPKETYNMISDVQIVGNITNKVTFLSLTYQTFCIIDSDLNVENIIYDKSNFDPNLPKKIKFCTFQKRLQQV